MVESDEDVQAAASAISTLERVSIDTEFHAERRYHPEFLLIQVCGPDGETWIGDPKACDLSPLIRAVSTRQVVLHAGQEDLGIMQREADTAPHDLLDVQIGSAMIGLGYPTRLGSISAALLNQAMDKAVTLSDWAQRPLGRDQLLYAAADVQVLHPLAECIIERLKQRGRLQWAQAASVELATRVTRPRKVKHTWTDWEIAHRMTPITQATLKAIFEWRDARGRDKNQPPHYMLSDGLALDIARRRPTSVQSLQANRRMPGGLVRRYGEEIVGVVARTNATEPMPPHVPTLEERHCADFLSLWAKSHEKKTDIAASLAMPRDLALRIARDGTRALTGWRAEALGEDVAAVMDGKKGLFMDLEGVKVR